MTADYSVGVPLLFASLCPFVFGSIPMDFAFSVYPSLSFTFGMFSRVFQSLLLVIVLCGSVYVGLLLRFYSLLSPSA